MLVDPVKAYWVADIQLYTLLDLTRDGGILLPSCSCRFILEQRAHVTRWIGGWVGSRIGLYLLENIRLKLRNTVGVG